MFKKIAILLIVAVLGAGGFTVWRYQSASARSEKIEAEILKGMTEDDIKLIFGSQKQTDGAAVAEITQTPEARGIFLKGLKEYLALAAEARREGMAEDKNFIVNLTYKKNMLLADLYKAKLSGEQGKPLAIPAEELEKVWIDPRNEEQFAVDMDALKKIQTATFRIQGSELVPTKLQGESLIKARENWARTKILSDLAKADAEFMKRREVELRFRVLESGILSADFLRKHWPDRVQATESEIESYIAARPEYDLNRKYKTAEDVLQRARAGENFAKLVREFSEHRPSKTNGGLLENAKKGEMWPQLEQAALALEEGQIADRLVETEMGYHIVKLEKKRAIKDENGMENTEFSIRHILFQNKFEEPDVRDPNIPPPFMTAREIAKSQLEKEKRNRFVAEITARNQISMPDDFTLGPEG